MPSAKIDIKSDLLNDRCPISGEKIYAGDLSEECIRPYRGGIVGFCCPKCVAVWEALPHDEKEDKLHEAFGGKSF